MTTSIVLSDDELLDILENRIPALVERRPELWKRVYSAWVDVFARREEIAAIMEELRHLGDSLNDFRASTTERFDRLEGRMGGVEGRIDRLDAKVDTLDAKVDGLDAKVDGLDAKVDGLDAKVDGLDAKVDAFGRDLSDTRAWFELTVGRLQTRAGRNLEDVVAAALRIGLHRPDVRADQIKLRQFIVDTEGAIYKPGKQKEVDLVASNGEYIVFEVKSAAKPGDVDDFAEKVALMRLLNPNKLVRSVFITLAPENDVRERCQELGIELAR